MKGLCTREKKRLLGGSPLPLRLRIQGLNAFTCMCACLLCLLSVVSCDDDDNGPSLTGDSKVYTLTPVEPSSANGTATFAKRSDNTVVVTLDLDGTVDGESHPAHIHLDNAADGGSIAIDLNPVDGTTGTSETIIDEFNDGSTVDYETLLDFDGHINVHESATNLATLIAQGDIGTNELTGTSSSYPLSSVSDPAIDGIVTFEERVNGETLATIELNGTAAGNSHPAHIHQNSAAMGGGIVIDFSDVDGETGISRTNIAAFNDDTPITYSELLEYDGYVNVHLSSTSLATLIAQGDIGSNALTGESEVYTLNSVSDPGIQGTATFEERSNGGTLVTIELEGTTAGNSHPSHIHANSAAEGGGIIIDLTNVNGTTGISKTDITTRNDGTPVSYDDLIGIDGYINVHLSSANLATLIAQGDVGANAVE